MPLTPSLTMPCGLTVANRAALAPLTNTAANPDGTVSDAETAFLSARARGGFGLVSTCATSVSAGGACWEGQLSARSDAHTPGLTGLAAALKAHGSAAIVQLQHGGAKATVAPDPIAPSATEGARAATEADIEAVLDDFVAAALRCQSAGFDGVELHGANGYLLTQFLAPADNQRSDRWGGELAGRARLLRTVLQRVRAAVAPSFAVGVRLSPVDGYERRGLVLSDSTRLAGWLADDGADFVHLSLRQAAGPAPHESDPTPVTTAMRAALPATVPLFAAGGIWTLDDARAARAAGADVVVVGRAAIAHADWPVAVTDPTFSPARPPWTSAQLRDQHVSERFQQYITPFGLIAGTAAGR